MRPLIRGAGLREKDMDLRCAHLGKQFTLRKRTPHADEATDAVDAIMEARKEADGTWVQVEVVLPTGTNLQTFIERDRSFAQKRVGFHLSRAARVLRARLGDMRVDIAKSSQAVVVEWQEVVTMRFDPGDGRVQTTWNDALLRDLGCRVDEVCEVYAAMVAPTSASGRPPPRG